VNAYCDELATVVGQTKLAVFATVDVRPTNAASLSHSVSASVYITMCVRQRVARQLILVTTEPCVSRIQWEQFCCLSIEIYVRFKFMYVVMSARPT